MAYAHCMQDARMITMTLHARAKLRYNSKYDDDDKQTSITM
jgi:hypothetical protein